MLLAIQYYSKLIALRYDSGRTFVRALAECIKYIQERLGQLFRPQKFHLACSTKLYEENAKQGSIPSMGKLICKAGAV